MGATESADADTRPIGPFTVSLMYRHVPCSTKRAQHLFKLHPRMDAVFEAILRRDAAAQIDTMNLKEFMGLCLAKNLVDSKISKKRKS